jgi:hypothetical protein
VNETPGQPARQQPPPLANFALPDRRESRYVSMQDAEYPPALPRPYRRSSQSIFYRSSRRSDRRIRAAGGSAAHASVRALISQFWRRRRSILLEQDYEALGGRGDSLAMQDEFGGG